jgi:hypothetical protein
MAAHNMRYNYHPIPYVGENRLEKAQIADEMMKKRHVYGPFVRSDVLPPKVDATLRMIGGVMSVVYSVEGTDTVRIFV